MLTNYNAKAVADVMGLAFLRESAGTSRSRSTTSRTKRPDAESDLMIRIDDDALIVVEAKSSAATPSASQRVSPPSSLFIERAVEMGLPRSALRHVAESIAGGDKTKVSALEWGVVPKTTLERRETRLSPQESERTERVARLFVHAARALGSEDEARAFMTTPHPELDGRSPIDAARTDLGTRRTEQLLNALEYGLAI